MKLLIVTVENERLHNLIEKAYEEIGNFSNKYQMDTNTLN